MTTAVLVLNCGSSSLKFAVVDPGNGHRLATGLAERVGTPEASGRARFAGADGVLTYFALDLGSMLGGAVVTERVFSIQGLGALLMDAVGTTDVPVVMGVTLVSAAFVVLANLVMDAVATLIDPRV